jgi:hypothetical protein
MPALIIEYAFEEIEIIPGLYASGTAEIAVHNDGEWFVRRIFLNGENNKPEEIDFMVPRNTIEREIYFAILDELEYGKRAPRVEAAVQEAIEGELINREAAE